MLRRQVSPILHGSPSLEAHADRLHMIARRCQTSRQAPRTGCLVPERRGGNQSESEKGWHCSLSGTQDTATTNLHCSSGSLNQEDQRSHGGLHNGGKLATVLSKRIHGGGKHHTTDGLDVIKPEQTTSVSQDLRCFCGLICKQLGETVVRCPMPDGFQCGYTVHFAKQVSSGLGTKVAAAPVSKSKALRASATAAPEGAAAAVKKPRILEHGLPPHLRRQCYRVLFAKGSIKRRCVFRDGALIVAMNDRACLFDACCKKIAELRAPRSRWNDLKGGEDLSDIGLMLVIDCRIREEDLMNGRAFSSASTLIAPGPEATHLPAPPPLPPRKICSRAKQFHVKINTDDFAANLVSSKLQEAAAALDLELDEAMSLQLVAVDACGKEWKLDELSTETVSLDMFPIDITFMSKKSCHTAQDHELSSPRQPVGQENESKVRVPHADEKNDDDCPEPPPQSKSGKLETKMRAEVDDAEVAIFNTASSTVSGKSLEAGKLEKKRKAKVDNAEIEKLKTEFKRVFGKAPGGPWQRRVEWLQKQLALGPGKPARRKTANQARRKEDSDDALVPIAKRCRPSSSKSTPSKPRPVEGNDDLILHGKPVLEQTANVQQSERHAGPHVSPESSCFGGLVNQHTCSATSIETASVDHTSIIVEKPSGNCTSLSGDLAEVVSGAFRSLECALFGPRVSAWEVDLQNSLAYPQGACQAETAVVNSDVATRKSRVSDPGQGTKSTDRFADRRADSVPAMSNVHDNPLQYGDQVSPEGGPEVDNRLTPGARASSARDIVQRDLFSDVCNSLLHNPEVNVDISLGLDDAFPTQADRGLQDASCSGFVFAKYNA